MKATDEVIAFWFGTLRPKDWWSAAPDIDDLVRARFSGLVRATRAAPPDPAGLDARGHLAAVLVLDQFPRHLFRDSADAFASDHDALGIALHAIDARVDAELPAPQRHFLYMPLMHSEDMAMQLRSIALYTALGERDALRSAEFHRATIDRFGRFPSRNELLMRPSTPEERAFLAEHPVRGRGRRGRSRVGMAPAEPPYPSSIAECEGRR